jgi:hypothetical protein
MSKIICVSGDSFTQEFHQKHEDKWSVKIGARDNIAMGGASNARIFYKTIEYLCNNTPDILIIGWTSTARDMLYSSEGERLIIAPHRCFGEETAEDREDIHKFYYSNLFNEFVIFQNTLNYMLHLQEFCKIKKIKLLYFRSVCHINLDEISLRDLAKKAHMIRTDKDIELQGIEYNIKILKNLILKLDKTIWIQEFWFSMLEYIKNRYIIEIGFDKPLPSAGVDEWANLVKKYL